MTGGEILSELCFQLLEAASYVSSDIMRVARMHRFDVDADWIDEVDRQPRQFRQSQRKTPPW